MTNNEAADKIVEKAATVAQEVVEQAAQTARELSAEREEKNVQALSQALSDTFGFGVETKRFVDVSRIPLICQSIVDMHDKIEKIENNINWGVKLVVGAVIVAVLALIIKK